MTRRRGFSLIEMCVYSSLLLMLLGGLYLFVSNGARYLRLGVAFQDAQSEALVAMRRLTEELATSTEIARSPGAPLDSDHIIFLSPDGPPLSGETPAAGDPEWFHDPTDLSLAYRRWVCYYWNSTTLELVRAQQDVGATPVTTDPPPTAPSLASFQALPGRVVARGISDPELAALGLPPFRVSQDSDPKLLDVQLSATVETASDKVTTVTTRSVVRMPNN